MPALFSRTVLLFYFVFACTIQSLSLGLSRAVNLTQASGIKPPAKNVRTSPLVRFPFSLQAKRDSKGFYLPAIALCDDYPEESRNKAKVLRDMETMQKIGVHILRCGIAWGDIERAPGKRDWTFWDMLVRTAVQHGIQLIPYVCYTPEWLAESNDRFWIRPPRQLQKFGIFMFDIARRYKGKILSWELWNEPDNPEFWLGTAEQFAQLTRIGAAAVRRADPGAVVVLGGIASPYPTQFLKTLQSEFNIENYVDVINIHGYNETWSLDRMERYPDQIEATAAAIQLPRNTPDLWFAEFGYSNYRTDTPANSGVKVPAYYPFEHTASYQAAALFKMHILALASGRISLMAWYRINDLKPSQNIIGDENNKFLGILDVNGNPKPALYAMQYFNHLLDAPVRCIDSSLQVHSAKNSQHVVHAFQKKNGDIVIAAWLALPAPKSDSESALQAVVKQEESISIELPTQMPVHFSITREDETKLSSQTSFDGKLLKNLLISPANVSIAVISAH